MAKYKTSPVARSVLMTLNFYRSHGKPAVFNVSGRSVPTVAFNFSRPGDNPGPGREDWMTVRFPDPTFEQPPARLEARNGIRGIACNYRLPRGLSAEQVQTYARIVRHQERTGAVSRKKADQRMNRLYRALERLNPELRALSFDRKDRGKVSDAVWGVASAFNARDIQFFLAGNTWGSANENGKYAAQIGRLGEKLKEGYVGWVAAPKTLTKIWRQVRDRKTEKTPEQKPGKGPAAPRENQP